MQALSEDDRSRWMNAMDGKEPVIYEKLELDSFLDAKSVLQFQKVAR